MVIECWEFRAKGRTVLSALIQRISRDRSWFGGQCTRVGFSRASRSCFLLNRSGGRQARCSSPLFFLLWPKWFGKDLEGRGSSKHPSRTPFLA